MKYHIFVWVALIFTAVSGVSSLWYDECGVSKYEDAGSWPDGGMRAKMIVGGVNARKNEFPWQVSLRFPPATDGLYHFCGGVLIHPEWVLTAAHCTTGERAEDIIVVVGEHDDSEPDSDHPSRERYTVTEIFEHEDYVGVEDNYNNDIALLKVAENVTLNEDVVPACQPVAGNTYVGDICQVSGWGTVEWGTPQYPSILQWTEMGITNNTYCENKLKEKSDSFYVTENMVCAADFEDHTQRDTCQGDSGGPMTVINSDGLFELVGLTSWGWRCADETPGVYTRVTEYIDWVQDRLDYL